MTKKDSAKKDNNSIPLTPDGYVAFGKLVETAVGIRAKLSQSITDEAHEAIGEVVKLSKGDRKEIASNLMIWLSKQESWFLMEILGSFRDLMSGPVLHYTIMRIAEDHRAQAEGQHAKELAKKIGDLAELLRSGSESQRKRK
jgi:hypothetical protein